MSQEEAYSKVRNAARFTSYHEINLSQCQRRLRLSTDRCNGKIPFPGKQCPRDNVTKLCSPKRLYKRGTNASNSLLTSVCWNNRNNKQGDESGLDHTQFSRTGPGFQCNDNCSSNQKISRPTSTQAV
jgi:hypothetical protein